MNQSGLTLTTSKTVIQDQMKSRLMILMLLPPPLPRLAPSAGPSSLEGPVPKKRGNSIRARIIALTMFDDASQAGKPPDFKAIQAKTNVTRLSVYKLRLKAISRG